MIQSKAKTTIKQALKKIKILKMRRLKQKNLMDIDVNPRHFIISGMPATERYLTRDGKRFLANPHG